MELILKMKMKSQFREIFQRRLHKEAIIWEQQVSDNATTQNIPRFFHN